MVLPLVDSSCMVIENQFLVSEEFGKSQGIYFCLVGDKSGQIRV